MLQTCKQVVTSLFTSCSQDVFALLVPNLFGLRVSGLREICCPFCKDTLLSHVDHMGKTANDAVFATAVRDEDLGSDDDTELQIDKDDNDLDEGRTETEINENYVNNLNAKISLWQRSPLL